jgi:small multidrug resistance pump
MAWAYLMLAIVFEIAGTTALKMSEGFVRLLPSLLILPAYAVSFGFLAMAIRDIPISVAYAIWSAVGIAAIAAIGFAFFREPVTLVKVAFIGVIIIGVVGLQLTEATAGSSSEFGKPLER